VTTEDEVRDASSQFYAALNTMANGDAGPLGDIWSQSADVTTMHPIGGREVGWDAVKASWEGVAGVASDGKIELRDQLVRVAGDMAYEVGTEHGAFKVGGEDIAIEHRVTNVYQREGGVWKITHHHTDLSPAMMDVLSSLSG
jgi:ketosteroid isomerase-like protein